MSSSSCSRIGCSERAVNLDYADRLRLIRAKLFRLCCVLPVLTSSVSISKIPADKTLLERRLKSDTKANAAKNNLKIVRTHGLA